MVTSSAAIQAQNDALIASIKNGTATAKTQSETLNADFSTFLTLLTTQLQNQDPLNPTDTAQFTNQLVMYTQAEQQMKTNSKLDSLITLNNANLGAQGLAYIGKDVTYGGNTIYNDGAGKSEDVIYSLPSAASNMSLAIKDSEGNTVRTIAYNSGAEEMTTGVHTFDWDGLSDSGGSVPKGEYTVTLTATDSAGKTVTADAVIRARVYGMEVGTDGTASLILAGNRSIAMSAVNSVQSPVETSTTQQNS